MTDREVLEQKSFSDLVEIAVTFNLFTREEANTKTAGELIAVIANDEPQKDATKKKKTTTKKTAAAKESATEEKKTTAKDKTAKAAPKKTSSKQKKSEEKAEAKAAEEKVAVEETTTEKPVKKTTKSKKTETVETKEEAKEEPKKESSKATTKKTKASSKTKAAPEIKDEPKENITVEATTEVKTEEAATEVKETKKKVSKTKKTTKADAKKASEEKPAEVKAEESKSDEPAAEEVKAEVKDETKAVVKKKPARSSKSKKASEEPKKEETSEGNAPATTNEAKSEEEPKVSEEKASEDSRNIKKSSRRNSKSKKTKNSDEVKATEETKEPSSDSADKKTESKEEKNEGKPEQKNNNVSNKNKKHQKTRRRTLSFGQENGEVVISEIETKEIPAEGSANAEPEAEAVPEVVEPEIQYIEVEGVLSIGTGDKGDFNGFIHKTNYLPGDEDAFVQGQLIRRMGLRRGDYIKGLAVAPKGKEKYAPLKRVLSVNGIELTEDTDLDVLRKRKRFESLTAIYPDQKLKLETDFGGARNDISTRIIDLFSPIGKGQRGMIVSPPKAGKTVLLKKVANAIKANNPNCHLIVLLIDERPEEVTDMQRSINGEVVYSTFDKKPENHVRVTELVLERAMRLVEIGEDVVILLDSMTRLARAYNLTINPTGRTLSGGLDPGSLYGPKRFFGAARNIENGGSLTIIATALIETGSRMDEVIFEEFKGTGNMEVTLDRKLADRRVFPAIAVDKSGTRREDLLLTPEELEAIWLLRKRIADVDTTTATDAVINFMQKTTNNTSFVLSIKKSFAVDD